MVYAYDVKPATFTVAINGSEIDPTAGLTVLEAILKTAVTKPLGRDVIKRYKETARGDWALEAVTLTDRAWQIASAVNQGADPAMAQTVVAAIDRVTPADVQRIAKTYLQRYAVAVDSAAPPGGNLSLRVALVHDYLNQRGGAERVFAHFLDAYPDAPVYTSIYSPTNSPTSFRASRVRTSFLQKFPFKKRLFRAFAPLYPRAFESFDLRAYDTIVSSTTSWAKGVIVPPGAVHVCYINTVSRFVFDEQPLRRRVLRAAITRAR